MTTDDRERAKALGNLVAEDIAISQGLTTADLHPAWSTLGEAVGAFVFSKGELERVANLGALFWCVAHLPDKFTK